MENFHKIIIIGAGPIGLYLASRCEEEKLDYLIIESSDVAGGQLTHLYPEKLIVDIPGIESIKAKNYIELLLTKIDKSRLLLNQTITEIKPGEIVELSSAKRKYSCEKLVISTGLGSTVPRPLGIENEDACSNIFYSLKEYDFLINKRVAIFGGGDSALDWAKALSEISNDIHLIHRREEFRGNEETIRSCYNLFVHKPYVPFSIKMNNGKAESITIKKVSDSEEEFIEIAVDYIFVNFGNLPISQSKFPFKMIGAFLPVDGNFQIEKNIFAIGDVSQHENKTRRIAPGNKEADKVFYQII